MKRLRLSTRAVMLGILMGMSAWVADALISWWMFPGSSFPDLLLYYDPDRTFYVRAIVVILFFSFGLYSGRLIERLETLQAHRERDIQVLEGVRRVHEVAVRQQGAEDMMAALEVIFIRALGCKDIKFVLCSHPLPEADEIARELHCAIDSEVVVALQDLLHHPRQDPEPLRRVQADGRLNVGLIRFQEQVYGYFTVELDSEWAQEIWRQPYIRSLFQDIGLALARLDDRQLLARSEQRLQELYDEAPIGIFTTTFSGKVLFVNRHLARMMGRNEPAEILEDVESVQALYADASQREAFLSTLRDAGFIHDFETTFLTKEGERLQARLAARVTDWQLNGDPVIEGFVLDETKQKVSEAAAKNLAERLQEARHLMTVAGLAGGVAHEFNNILQAMMGSAYLAQMTMDAESDSVQYLKDIEEAGLRASKLCDKMLSYSGRKAMVMQVVPARKMLNRIKPELDRLTKKQRVDLKTHHAAHPVSIRVDPMVFPETIMHLIQNAMEALPRKGVREIRLETDVLTPDEAWCERYNIDLPPDAGQYWVLKVIDSGEGIPKELQGRIFDPFYTTRFQGRGLGLSAVQGMVDRSEGVVGLRSEPDQDTEFVIGLPVASSVEFEI